MPKITRKMSVRARDLEDDKMPDRIHNYYTRPASTRAAASKARKKIARHAEITNPTPGRYAREGEAMVMAENRVGEEKKKLPDLQEKEGGKVRGGNGRNSDRRKLEGRVGETEEESEERNRRRHKIEDWAGEMEGHIAGRKPGMPAASTDGKMSLPTSEDSSGIANPNTLDTPTTKVPESSPSGTNPPYPQNRSAPIITSHPSDELPPAHEARGKTPRKVPSVTHLDDLLRRPPDTFLQTTRTLTPRRASSLSREYTAGRQPPGIPFSQSMEELHQCCPTAHTAQSTTVGSETLISVPSVNRPPTTQREERSRSPTTNATPNSSGKLANPGSSSSKKSEVPLQRRVDRCKEAARWKDCKTATDSAELLPANSRALSPQNAAQNLRAARPTSSSAENPPSKLKYPLVNNAAQQLHPTAKTSNKANRLNTTDLHRVKGLPSIWETTSITRNKTDPPAFHSSSAPQTSRHTIPPVPSNHSANAAETEVIDSQSQNGETCGNPFSKQSSSKPTSRPMDEYTRNALAWLNKLIAPPDRASSTSTNRRRRPRNTSATDLITTTNRGSRDSQPRGGTVASAGSSSTTPMFQELTLSDFARRREARVQRTSIVSTLAKSGNATGGEKVTAPLSSGTDDTMTWRRSQATAQHTGENSVPQASVQRQPQNGTEQTPRAPLIQWAAPYQPHHLQNGDTSFESHGQDWAQQSQPPPVISGARALTDPHSEGIGPQQPSTEEQLQRSSQQTSSHVETRMVPSIRWRTPYDPSSQEIEAHQSRDSTAHNTPLSDLNRYQEPNTGRTQKENSHMMPLATQTAERVNANNAVQAMPPPQTSVIDGLLQRPAGTADTQQRVPQPNSAPDTFQRPNPPHPQAQTSTTHVQHATAQRIREIERLADTAAMPPPHQIHFQAPLPSPNILQPQTGAGYTGNPPPPPPRIMVYCESSTGLSAVLEDQRVATATGERKTVSGKALAHEDEAFMEEFLERMFKQEE